MNPKKRFSLLILCLLPLSLTALADLTDQELMQWGEEALPRLGFAIPSDVRTLRQYRDTYDFHQLLKQNGVPVSNPDDIITGFTNIDFTNRCEGVYLTLRHSFPDVSFVVAFNQDGRRSNERLVGLWFRTLGGFTEQGNAISRAEGYLMAALSALRRGDQEEARRQAQSLRSACDGTNPRAVTERAGAPREDSAVAQPAERRRSSTAHSAQ